MIVWVEWGRCKTDYDPLSFPDTPNVFSSLQNLLEYWKRVWFPADTVDRAYESWNKHLTENLTVGWGDTARYAKGVELDDYFVRKAAKENTETEKHGAKKSKT